MSRDKGYFYSAVTGKAVGEDLGKKAFKEFFRIERSISELFQQLEMGTDEEGLDQRMEVEITAALARFDGSEEERRVVEDILWSMTNYLRFHLGDALHLGSSRQYGSYWDIPGGDVKVGQGEHAFKLVLQIPGGYSSLVEVLRRAVLGGEENKKGATMFTQARVTRVDYSTEKVEDMTILRFLQVKVATEEEEFTCDHVLVSGDHLK